MRCRSISISASERSLSSMSFAVTDPNAFPVSPVSSTNSNLTLLIFRASSSASFSSLASLSARFALSRFNRFRLEGVISYALPVGIKKLRAYPRRTLTMLASAPNPGQFSFKMISVTDMLISFRKAGGDWYVRMIQLSSTRGEFRLRSGRADRSYRATKKSRLPNGRRPKGWRSITWIESAKFQYFLGDIDWFFLLAQCPAQFRQRYILELADSLTRNPELLTHFFESLRFAAVQSEPLEDNLAFAVVQDLEQLTHLVAQVLVSEQLKRRLRIFIPNNLTKFRRVVIADRCVQRSGPNRDGFQLRDFSARNTDLFRQLIVGGFTAKFFTHLQRNSAHLGNLVDQVNRKPNGFTLICQRSFDRLFNPPNALRTQFSALGRIEALDRFHQPDIAFRY